MQFIRVGTLDEHDRLPPDIHIFTASKQPRVVLGPGTPAVEEYYDGQKFWPEESLARYRALRSRTGWRSGQEASEAKRYPMPGSVRINFGLAVLTGGLAGRVRDPSRSRSKISY